MGKGLLYFAQSVRELASLAKDLANGELSGKMPSRGNEMASSLKSLHATLKHLTWQTQQVAKGDYLQRVNFMGDFSEAFNTMVEQLDERQTALMEEIRRSREKELALTQSNNLFEAITRQISQWIIVMDKKNRRWLFANHDAGGILFDQACESHLREWLASRAGDMENEPRTAEMELTNGEITQYFSVVVHPLNWYGHNSLAFVLTDISHEKEHLQELENAAYRDTLTKEYNRHYGMNILNKWLTHSYTFIICFVDIDNLKYVNDKYGHAEGDKYILCVVGILRDFSSDAIICRLGGDEFMLLAQGWGMNDAEERFETLRLRLTAHNDQLGSFYNHSMSYGVIEVGAGSTMSASDLLGIADEKMYEYKRAHKAQRNATLTS
ncbi:MAG: diguanylate cyclase [Synergistaceae bacterium]|nr:diguanylate cyclase [Synergistaceae bacterium]